VYRYDALAGSLVRVSVGEAGSEANGNSDGFDASIALAGVRRTVFEEHDLNSRAVSQDGMRVVFTSAGPLSLAVANGVVNAYEWHEGAVSLVSSGSSDQPVGQVVTSSSGNDVFFTTTQGLVRQDTDGQSDVYDARMGGGFPVLPLVSEPCSGDACQGPLTNPAPLLVPGSASQAPGENYLPPVAVHKAKPKHAARKKVKPKHAAKGKTAKSRHKRGRTSRRVGERGALSGGGGR
jgi:hypothetical protein